PQPRLARPSLARWSSGLRRLRPRLAGTLVVLPVACVCVWSPGGGRPATSCLRRAANGASSGLGSGRAAAILVLLPARRCLLPSGLELPRGVGEGACA